MSTTMEKFEIRTAGPEDRDYIIRLMGGIYAGDMSSRYEWLYESNPHGRALSWVAIEREIGEAVGCTSIFPRRAGVESAESGEIASSSRELEDKVSPLRCTQRASRKCVNEASILCTGLQLPTTSARWSKPARIWWPITGGGCARSQAEAPIALRSLECRPKGKHNSLRFRLWCSID